METKFKTVKEMVKKILGVGFFEIFFRKKHDFFD